MINMIIVVIVFCSIVLGVQKVIDLMFSLICPEDDDE